MLKCSGRRCWNKGRWFFFLRKSNLGILFSNNKWETNLFIQKILFRECFQCWSKLDHAHIWFSLWFFHCGKSYSEQYDFRLWFLSEYPFPFVSPQSRGGSTICSKAEFYLSLNYCLSWTLVFFQELKNCLMFRSHLCWSFWCYLLFIIVTRTLCHIEVLTRLSEMLGCYHKE